MTLAPRTQDRIRAALPVLLVHALLALLILNGLGLVVVLPPRERTTLLDIEPPAPPPMLRPRRTGERAARREGEAAPAARESRPTEIVAPPDMLPLPLPIPAAPVAGPGTASTSGATPLPGPGTGAGGIGNGTGSGDRGDGPGGGGSGAGGDGGRGGFTPPRRIRGRISDRDYPHGLGESGVDGLVSVIYAVQPDGRATDCRITRSSGSIMLDDTTCRLIEQRFRFEPSRDRNGRPVRSRIVQDHYWEVEDEPREEEPPPRRRRRFGF